MIYFKLNFDKQNNYVGHVMWILIISSKDHDGIVRANQLNLKFVMNQLRVKLRIKLINIEHLSRTNAINSREK